MLSSYDLEGNNQSLRAFYLVPLTLFRFKTCQLNDIRVCVLMQILETFSNHTLKIEDSSSDTPLMQQCFT
jgi:hypothetical protein